MFLLRAVFWLAILILILPANEKSGEPAPGVTAVEALVAARDTFGDLSAFCSRQPDVCDTGSAAFLVFADRFKAGASMLYGYLNGSGADTPSDRGGTLTPGDAAPAWRNPVSDESV